MTGSPEPQQQDPILLVEVYDLNPPPVRRYVRPKGVEGPLDAIDGVHGGKYSGSQGSETGVTSQESGDPVGSNTL